MLKCTVVDRWFVSVVLWGRFFGVSLPTGGMTRGVIQIGTGGWGEQWCRKFLPPNVESGRIEVVAAVDTDAGALENAQDGLDLPETRCYTDLETALEARAAEADVCTVAVPPAAHESVVETVLKYDLDVLCEKPIADTLEGACRIAERVDRAGATMGVTMSHRFDRDKTTLRRALRSDAYGPLSYLVYRFTQDCREYGEWDRRLYDTEDALVSEGSIHHLDILADLADSRCETVYARTTAPDWSDFTGASQVFATVTFENGVQAQYEASTANAAGLNGWGSDYVRAECRDATLELDRRELMAYEHDPDADPSHDRDDLTGEPVPLADGEHWGNTWLIEQFVDWLDGGESFPTDVESNLQSVALVESVLQSAAKGHPVAVQELLGEAREQARADLR